MGGGCAVKSTCVMPPAPSHIQQQEAAAVVQLVHRLQPTARLLYVGPGLICIENINQDGSVSGNLPRFRTETDCAWVRGFQNACMCGAPAQNDSSATVQVLCLHSSVSCS